MAHIKVVARFFFELSKLAVQTRHLPDDRLFVRAVYRSCLRREPDASGESFYLQALQQRRMRKVDVLRAVLESNEFKKMYDLPVSPLNALHQARMMLIQKHLPKAQFILDLGGTADDHPEGALLVMGYPYKPAEIIIVDPVLPKSLREYGRNPEWTTPEGVLIRYYQCSMTDLSWIPDESMDLVFSGESIEHISEEEAQIVCMQVYRILRTGGYFCLDTPNAALTRLQSPENLIHPEHKKEYLIHEIREMLGRNNFLIAEEIGICPMPVSLSQRSFDTRELVQNVGLSKNPEEAYLFFVKAVKP
jgi:ubiquinone/menaquinone biosynthesis C-methylase UbiE